MAAVLLVGLCGCEDECVPEIDVNNLTGKWLKEYPEGVVAEGYVQWTFGTEGESYKDKTLEIYVYDVFAGDYSAKYTYLTTTDGEATLLRMYTAESSDSSKPVATYEIKECSKKVLVLNCLETNVDGPNMLEGDVTFTRSHN